MHLHGLLERVNVLSQSSYLPGSSERSHLAFLSLTDETKTPNRKTILSRLDLAGNANPHRFRSPDDPSPAALRRHRRRPFLHLTRLGTLDDDFFSGDDDDGRSLFGSHKKASFNGSLLAFGPFNLKSGFSDLVIDNGIRVSEVVRSGITFKTEGLSFTDDKDNDNEKEAENEKLDLGNGQEVDRAVDLQFFIKGLELGRRDAAALFLLVSMLSAAYGWVILVFLVTYSWVLGTVFITVVNDLLGRFSSIAVMSPWVRGFEKEISGFLFTWFLVDTFVAFIFSVDAWVAIVDTRRSGREIVKEGCYLISTMLNQAIQIKCLEAICCGSFVRWVLARVCGRSFAKMFQTIMEVYFMVVWLIFYFASRCKDANQQGRRFGQRELEGLVVTG
ncbi:Transmembrane protein [Senna tora]|uniref:Transmembrane protein n=1 Tax=Senna tora TaxID=362788 RepID=A0A834WCT1_9FABA|nr:Transmembrane protein [Senna tora]